MPTASTSAPPASQPSTSGGENSSLQSNAIQNGADLLLELFNEEKTQLSLVYSESFEKCFNQFKMHTEAQIVAANSQLAKKTALMGVLATQYDRSMQDLEATRNELQQVRAEYAKLMASVDDVGLVYMNGTLHFNDNTAKIVSDFREGARMQDMAISHMNPDTAPVPPDHNVEAPSKTIKPSDFFAFLSDVMEKGQRYAHGLKMHQQRRSASLSEGNTSTNDAALQDAELEQDSSHVGPGISPTYSPSLSENKFPK